MIPSLLWPLLSVLVLPIGWLELRLPVTRWALLYPAATGPVFYGPWVAAVMSSPNRINDSVTLAIGIGMAAVGLALFLIAGRLILAVPGQMTSMPKRLATQGPYRWMRHPMYAGHVLMISGGVLALGASWVFLETPLLWAIMAIAARLEERMRLSPVFGDTFERYQERTPLLLPLWGWLLWGLIYVGVIVRWLIA